MRISNSFAMVLLALGCAVLTGCAAVRGADVAAAAGPVRSAVLQDYEKARKDGTEAGKKGIKAAIPRGEKIKRAEIPAESAGEDTLSGSIQPQKAGDYPEKTGENTPEVAGNARPDNGAAKTGESAHVHTFVPVYRTVHHEAVTRTEDRGHFVTVPVKEAWDEEVWEDRPETVNTNICNGCGKNQQFDFEGDFGAFADHAQFECNASYSFGPVHTGNTVPALAFIIHHEAEYEERWIPDIVTVTEREAYDEQVTDHYECACGAVR